MNMAGWSAVLSSRTKRFNVFLRGDETAPGQLRPDPGAQCCHLERELQWAADTSGAKYIIYDPLTTAANGTRNAGLKVIVDPMYGVGQLTLGIVLTEARCRVTFIHERHNPLFGGRSPAPNPEALRLLTSTMRDDGNDLGLAMDGDADCIAIVDDLGEYIAINEILLLLYWYLHEVRVERGGVVRNVATSHLLDRLAHRLGEQCYEVPVGFKHIVSAMVEHNALLGGESSGGLTIRGHILGKDGIFASALVVEMLARTGKKIGELRETKLGITGRLYSLEEAFSATPEMRIAVPRSLTEASLSRIGPYRPARISYLDGTKIYLENDNWLLVRFSGTEPVLRLVVESDSPEKARELIEWLKHFVAAQAEAQPNLPEPRKQPAAMPGPGLGS